MSVSITSVPPEVSTYYTNEEMRRAAEEMRQNNLDAATAFQLGLQLIQLAIYWDRYNDAIDDRDEKIDKQIEFMSDIQAYKIGQDLPMLRCKKDVLTQLNLPSVDACRDAVICADESEDDGDAVDLKSQHLADQTCGGIPSNWCAHEGSLAAAKAGSNAGGLIANNAKREQESFRQHKTSMVRTGQQGMKSVFNSGEILAMYSQGAAIHQGFADIFIAGFNSAGAAAGVLLGRLAGGNSTGSSGNPNNVGNSAGQSYADYSGVA